MLHGAVNQIPNVEKFLLRTRRHVERKEKRIIQLWRQSTARCVSKNFSYKIPVLSKCRVRSAFMNESLRWMNHPQCHWSHTVAATLQLQTVLTLTNPETDSNILNKQPVKPRLGISWFSESFRSCQSPSSHIQWISDWISESFSGTASPLSCSVDRSACGCYFSDRTEIHFCHILWIFWSWEIHSSFVLQISVWFSKSFVRDCFTGSGLAFMNLCASSKLRFKLFSFYLGSERLPALIMRISVWQSESFHHDRITPLDSIESVASVSQMSPVHGQHQQIGTNHLTEWPQMT